MKKEVYSWRLETDVKSSLERAAQLRKTSVSSVIDTAVRDWLQRNGPDPSDDEEQRRLHAELEKCMGAFAGRHPGRSIEVRAIVRERLRRRRER